MTIISSRMAVVGLAILATLGFVTASVAADDIRAMPTASRTCPVSGRR